MVMYVGYSGSGHNSTLPRPHSCYLFCLSSRLLFCIAGLHRVSCVGSGDKRDDDDGCGCCFAGACLCMCMCACVHARVCVCVCARAFVSGGSVRAVVTTFAGCGNQSFADGRGSNACFVSSYGVTVDVSGNVFAADDSQRIRKVTAGGGTRIGLVSLHARVADRNIGARLL
jgi:hypothetical protein